LVVLDEDLMTRPRRAVGSSVTVGGDLALGGWAIGQALIGAKSGTTAGPETRNGNQRSVRPPSATIT
jgi:hypothetical protein